MLRYWDGAQWTTDMQPAHQPATVGEGPRLTNRAALGIVAVLAVLLTVVFAVLGGGGDESGAPENLSTTEVQALDADALADVRTAQTAIETFATDHNGEYGESTPEALQQIEPALAGVSLTVQGQAAEYALTVESETGTSFSITRDGTGLTTFACDAPGEGGCPESGDWAQ